MADAHSDIRSHVKTYIAVFVALAAFTVITVVASQIDTRVSMHVAIALCIAGVKGLLVGAFFMHLSSERSAILWGVLALCVVFGVVLLVLPVLTAQDLPPGVRLGIWE